MSPLGKKQDRRTIIFDFDGVIVDSEKVFLRYWDEAFRSLNFSIPYESLLELRSCDSGLAKSLVERWTEDPNLYGLARAKRKELMEESYLNGEICLKPGISKLLRKLANDGWGLYIASSSSRERIVMLLNRYRILNCFSEVFSVKDLKRGKPFPDIYLRACDHLGLSPQEVFAVEDSPNGVRSAHEAGCKTIFLEDLTPLEEGLKSLVVAAFSKPEDLGGYLLGGQKHE